MFRKRGPRNQPQSHNDDQYGRRPGEEPPGLEGRVGGQRSWQKQDEPDTKTSRGYPTHQIGSLDTQAW